MNRFSHVRFDPNLNAYHPIDEAIEADRVEEDDDEDFQEDDDDEEDDEDEEEEEEEDEAEDIFFDNDGEIVIDEDDNIISISNQSGFREFQEQECLQNPFTVIDNVTLPSLKDTDLLMNESVTNPCSICLQRNCNTVILPCADSQFCLSCLHECFHVRQENGSPLICPTCCGPVTHVMKFSK